jgi:hypothetical protein
MPGPLGTFALALGWAASPSQSTTPVPAFLTASPDSLQVLHSKHTTLFLLIESAENEAIEARRVARIPRQLRPDPLLHDFTLGIHSLLGLGP